MRPTISLLLLSLLGAASSAPTVEVAERAPAAELEERTVGGVGLSFITFSSSIFLDRPERLCPNSIEIRFISAPMSTLRAHVVTRSSPWILVLCSLPHSQYLSTSDQVFHPNRNRKLTALDSVILQFLLSALTKERNVTFTRMIILHYHLLKVPRLNFLAVAHMIALHTAVVAPAVALPRTYSSAIPARVIWGTNSSTIMREALTALLPKG